MIGWIEAHPHAAQSGSVLIASLIAILAAAIAYRGAVKQATASRYQAEMAAVLAEKNRVKEMKAGATALASEICYWLVILTSIRNQVLEKRTSALYRLSKKRLRIPVFEASPRDLAVLDPDAVADLVSFYNSLDEHVEVTIDGFEHIRKKPEDKVAYEQLASTTEHVLMMGALAVEKLQNAAEIDVVRFPAEVDKTLKELRELRRKSAV